MFSEKFLEKWGDNPVVMLKQALSMPINIDFEAYGLDPNDYRPLRRGHILNFRESHPELYKDITDQMLAYYNSSN